MLKKLCLSLGFLLGVFTSSLALAQVCGDGGQIGTDLDGKTLICFNGTSGAHPYGQHPRDGIGSLPAGGTNTAGSQGGFASAPKVTVVNRFGAVALNADGSAFGFSSNQSSKIEAAQGAVNSCAQPGCRVVGTYANTCAAFAWGKLNHGGLTRLESGVTKEIAEASALEACNKKAKNCQILMSECSKL